MPRPASHSARAGKADSTSPKSTAARESVGTPLPRAERGDVDRITTTVRDALGNQAFAAEFDRGATLKPDEIIP